MIRQKFTLPRLPNKQELDFIERIEHTSDYYGLSEGMLEYFIKVNPRTLRTFKERYNNFKYVGIIPKGKIHRINNLYKLVTYKSKYARRYINQSNYNLICSAIDKHNTGRILGQLEHSNQLSLHDIAQMDYDELISQAKEYAKILEGEE